MKAKLLLASLLTFIIFLGGVSLVFADCTGCGDDGHQVCPIEDKAHKHITVMTEEHKTSSSHLKMVLYLQYVYLKLMRKQVKEN